MDRQQTQLTQVTETAQKTVLVLNNHTQEIKVLAQMVNELKLKVEWDYAVAHLMDRILADMLRDVSSSVDALATGRIPPYLVSLDMVTDILNTATNEKVRSIQAQLAYTLGSAIPIYVDHRECEFGFIINLPIVSMNNIYRLKDVINVGNWHGENHVKIHTPKVIAYHESDPSAYLAPNLQMCTLTHEIHYLCTSRPFIWNNAAGICGITSIPKNSKCSTTITPRHLVTAAQAERIGSRWLVNTPDSNAIMVYDRPGAIRHLNLPDKTMWVSVPKGKTIHIGDLTLYYLDPERWETTLEYPEYLTNMSLEIDPDTVKQIQFEGTKIVEVEPLNQVLKTLKSETRTPLQPITYAWSSADTLNFALIVILSLVVCGLAGIVAFQFRRIQSLQAQMDRYGTYFDQKKSRKQTVKFLKEKPKTSSSLESDDKSVSKQ